MFQTLAEVDDGWPKLEWLLFMPLNARAPLSPPPVFPPLLLFP